MKLAWDQHGNLLSNGRIVPVLLISYYFYFLLRLFLTALVARYIVYLAESCHGIPLWYFAVVGLVFAVLLARLTPESLAQLRRRCIAKWLADAAMPAPSISAALLNGLDALGSPTDPKAAAPLFLPKLRNGSERR